MLQDKASTGIALGFTLGTVIISVFQASSAGGGEVLVPAWSPTGRAHAVVTRAQICQHLRNYTQPSFQRYIIRIIFLASVPVACTCRGAQFVWPKPTADACLHRNRSHATQWRHAWHCTIATIPCTTRRRETAMKHGWWVEGTWHAWGTKLTSTS